MSKSQVFQADEGRPARLHLDIPGLSQEALSRGVEAATHYFESVDEDPYACALALFKQHGEVYELTDEDMRLISVWDEAEQLGMRAACAGGALYFVQCLEFLGPWNNWGEGFSFDGDSSAT